MLMDPFITAHTVPYMSVKMFPINFLSSFSQFFGGAVLNVDINECFFFLVLLEGKSCNKYVFCIQTKSRKRNEEWANV